jgi:hypothetical protein
MYRNIADQDSAEVHTSDHYGACMTSLHRNEKEERPSVGLGF